MGDVEEMIYVVEDEENDEEVKVSEKFIIVVVIYLFNVMLRIVVKMCFLMYIDY